MATRELVAHDKVAYVKRSLKELVIYLLYLTFACLGKYWN